MSDKIFLIGEKGKLHPMEERPYDTEDVLQGLLERYPDLLVGDQVDPDSPRRWLLVKREMGVPDADDASDRWSLDHLFLDQDGVLTLVEVKRVSDTRCRREVVAQMLDYAANAVLYWPVEIVMSSFESTVRDSGGDPTEALADFLGSGGGRRSPEEFWTLVKTNLEAERIRMVFVADKIPRELQRIVEFLNGQMDPARVVAVEVKQYVSEDGTLKTLVPRAVGQTVKSGQTTSRGTGNNWDEVSYLDAVRRDGGEQTVELTKRIIEWFEKNAAGVRWGKGQTATFTARAIVDGEDTELLRVFPTSMRVALGRLEEPIRENLRRRLLEIDGFNVAAGTWPPVELKSLADPAAWEKFVGVLTWFINEVKRVS